MTSVGALFRMCLLVTMLSLLAGTARAAQPVGFIARLSDVNVVGCGYDPDDPEAKIAVHVYAESGFPGVIGIADRVCPWSSDPRYAGHGFWIQYRRPVTSTSQVGVALIGTSPGEASWLPTSGVPTYAPYQRASQTLLIGTPRWQVGISKKFGAAVVEYYNRRVDGTLNLIHSEIGAAFQTAVFGGEGNEIPRDGQPVTCLGGTGEFWWNPTQAGALCPQFGGMFTPNPVWGCETSIAGACSATALENTYGWVRFYVRWRNFVYPFDPSGAYPYRVYDDVYGTVTYTVTEDQLQVDWQMWRDGAAAGGQNPPPSRGGSSWQQLPVLFGVQATELSYRRNGVITTDVRTAPGFSSSAQIDVDANDGRWVTLRSSQYNPVEDPIMTPGDHLTVGWYVKAHAGVCHPRRFQFDFFPGTGSPNPPQMVALQSAVYFQPAFGYYTEARAVLFPYLHSEVLPGRSTNLGTLLDTPEHLGGLMPVWECNR